MKYNYALMIYYNDSTIIIYYYVHGDELDENYEKALKFNKNIKRIEAHEIHYQSDKKLNLGLIQLKDFSNR